MDLPKTLVDKTADRTEQWKYKTATALSKGNKTWICTRIFLSPYLPQTSVHKNRKISLGAEGEAKGKRWWTSFLPSSGLLRGLRCFDTDVSVLSNRPLKYRCAKPLIAHAVHLITRARKIAKRLYYLRHVRLSARNKSAPTGRIFMKFGICAFSKNLSTRFKSRITGT